MKLVKLLMVLVFSVYLSTMAVAGDKGHVTAVKSNYDFKTTVDRVKKCIKSNKGVTLFAVIDHQANAKKAGVEMGKATLFVFGNPGNGGKLMQAYPQSAIDLPLKVLVFEDKGKVFISYVNPTDIAKNYKGAANHKFIKGAQGMLAAMVENVNKK